MCYYNGQKVTRAEFIKLKSLERAVSKYDFLDKGVISGFTDMEVAVIVATPDRSNFDIVQMEWGFIPNYLNNRNEVKRMRMPCILNDDLAWRWISEDLSDEDVLQIAATQFPNEEMDACTVASDFLGRLDPSEPFEYENLPALELTIEPGATGKPAQGDLFGS